MSTEKKSCIEEGGDVYLASTGTQSKSDFWLIDSNAFFHMTTHREWFYECERYNGNAFLGEELPKKIKNHGIVKLLLNDGIIKTLLDVLHILGQSKNLISGNKMDDASPQTVLKKDKCKMVLGEMVLMRGI